MNSQLHTHIFPNGFESWHETHFEVARAITLEGRNDTPSKVFTEAREADGHPGLYTLAVTLTDKFEKMNEGRQWDGEFYDEVEAFCKQELDSIK